MANLQEAIEFIRRTKQEDISRGKESIQAAYIARFNPQRFRSVYAGDGYALRFSEARTGTFSNTVLSLSALQMHDDRPFVVVVVRERTVDFLLANATFLRKISHSSLQLRQDNIKGSFNGTDIMVEYEGIPNRPENFDELFALHGAFTWAENVGRLVEATNAIVGRDSRFRPSDAQREILMAAPERAAAAIASPAFREIERELMDTVAARRAAIIDAARIDNVNLRGNAIEQVLTGGANRHDLGDLVKEVEGGPLVIDIKTKLLDRASAPKAYNVDKMLAFLAKPGSVFAFLMLAVDTQSGQLSARLLPVLEASLLEATVVQHHWAGRSSRGVTQLSGRFARGSAPDYRPSVDIARARGFLADLLAL
jgi:hypothetical protein